MIREYVFEVTLDDGTCKQFVITSNSRGYALVQCVKQMNEKDNEIQFIELISNKVKE